MTVVRCASHRARNRLLGRLTALGKTPEAVWAASVGSVYGCYQIDDADLKTARSINGVSVPRYNGDWLKCW